MSVVLILLLIDIAMYYYPENFFTQDIGQAPNSAVKI